MTLKTVFERPLDDRDRERPGPPRLDDWLSISHGLWATEDGRRRQPPELVLETAGLTDLELALRFTRQSIESLRPGLGSAFLEAAKLCDERSPAELALLYAVTVVGLEEVADEVVFRADGRPLVQPDPDSVHLVVEPQKEIRRRHHVDLFVALETWTPPRDQSGRIVRGDPVRGGSSVCVECDGITYHGDVARDAWRDQQVRKQGHLVHRYTAPDIFAYPFDCATSILDALVEDERRKRAPVVRPRYRRSHSSWR